MAISPSLRRKRDARRELPLPISRRAVREQVGLTQQDLARELGVRPSTISRWESGVRTPRGEALVHYVRLLKELESR